MRGLSARVVKTVDWQPKPASERPRREKKSTPTQARTTPRSAEVAEKPKPLPVPQRSPYLSEGKLDPKTAVMLAAMQLEYGALTQSDQLKAAMLSRLPALHGKQRWVVDSPAKRKVITTGRRWGKTTVAAAVSTEKACEGRRVLLASTTQDQADAFWEYITTWLAEFISAGYIKKNETKRTLLFPAFDPARGRGRIRVKTASDADTLRGDHADFLVLDECALLAPNAWREVGAPMLLDNNGDAWFLSTPKRKNWFHDLYQQAKADETGRWAAFEGNSFDNPHLSSEALEQIIKDLTEEAYQQEILAVFLEGEGAVFRNIKACMGDPLSGGKCAPATTVAEHEGHMKVMGGDWGQVNDNTAISILCVTCRREVFFDKFTKIQFALQRNRIKNAFYTWKPMRVLLEANSIGAPNLEALQNEGVPGEGFDTTKKSKPQIINQMSLALERETFLFLNVPSATAEFEAYEAKKSPVTGNVSYSAPEGMKDDSVIARSIAVEAAMNAGVEHGPGVSPYSSLPAVGYYGDESGADDMPTLAAYQQTTGYNQAMPAPPGRPW